VVPERFVTRGFVGRREPAGSPQTARIPPGQHLVKDFPVLSAGPTPRTPLASWSFELDRRGAFVTAYSDGGYTTNIALPELVNGQAFVAYEYEGRPLTPEHGGPARLLVPHLYFWKSAKWVRGLRVMERDEPGFWESLGYNNHGDPWKEERYSGD